MNSGIILTIYFHHLGPEEQRKKWGKKDTIHN